MAAEAGLDFVCKYCDKKFRNKYALGGHQNAHRFERAMDWTLKRKRRGGFMDYYPFSPFAGAGAGGYWNQAASMPLYFRPGYRIPSPEILVRPLPVEYRPPSAQVLPPAMNIDGGDTFPVGSGSTNSAVTPMFGSIAINSNPRNAPEMMEDGELDLNLKL
ncbi:zinc finger protein KNUCKLES-like [Ipomoea triloba]|uniref:zinc finger protein KNUCKLES-like n=1 Tax=Ipomoea triloba TaxID=35885 RepID=UPI00125DA43E|nr:zinc finger protein KNUCKLES-like [Ipomoea triloba]